MFSTRVTTFSRSKTKIGVERIFCVECKELKVRIWSNAQWTVAGPTTTTTTTTAAPPVVVTSPPATKGFRPLAIRPLTPYVDPSKLLNPNPPLPPHVQVVPGDGPIFFNTKGIVEDAPSPYFYTNRHRNPHPDHPAHPHRHPPAPVQAQAPAPVPVPVPGPVPAPAPVPVQVQVLAPVTEPEKVPASAPASAPVPVQAPAAVPVHPLPVSSFRKPFSHFFKMNTYHVRRLILNQTFWKTWCTYGR